MTEPATLNDCDRLLRHMDALLDESRRVNEQADEMDDEEAAQPLRWLAMGLLKLFDVAEAQQNLAVISHKAKEPMPRPVDEILADSDEHKAVLYRKVDEQYRESGEPDPRTASGRFVRSVRA